MATSKTKPTNSDTTENVEDVTEITEVETIVSERTAPQDFGPDNGSHNILAAWQGLYHLLGARVERWDVTNDGVFAIGVTFLTNRIPDVDTVVRDISYRGDKFVTRDLDLVPLYFYVQGQEPAPFEDAGSMTQWMAKFFRGAGEGDNNRSPQYVKDAITAYKTDNGIASRRGRPPKKIDIENLGSVSEEVLAQVPEDELAKLQATLDRIYAHKNTTVAVPA